MHELRCRSLGICDDLRAELETTLVPLELSGADHLVCLSAVTVTNNQFVRFLNETGIANHVGGTYLWLNDINVNLPVRWVDAAYEIRAGYEEHPVVGVTWNGAVLYALSLGARLPTGAEWEFAATTGEPSQQYPWGNEHPSPLLANFGQHVGTTTPVRAYPPNRWGFYDLSGNVRQWCSEWFEDVGAQPIMKVVRGGAWNKGTEHLATTVRHGKWARMGSDSCGFRLAVIL